MPEFLYGIAPKEFLGEDTPPRKSGSTVSFEDAVGDSAAQRREKAASIEREKAKWKRLFVRMSQKQVQEIFGHPDGVSDAGGGGQYYYYAGGYVSFRPWFHEGGEIEQVVDGWQAPLYY